MYSTQMQIHIHEISAIMELKKNLIVYEVSGERSF